MNKEYRFPMLVFLVVAIIALLALTANFDRLMNVAGRLVYDILEILKP